MQHKIEQFLKQIKEAVASEQLLLPSLPDVALQVREQCEKDEASLQTIADVLSQDPALSVATLPGLAPLESLGELPSDGDLYGFTRTYLVRERNRLEDQLEMAIAEARELEQVLSGSSGER